DILAATGKTVAQIQQAHWARFGRNYFTRHDYEDLPAETAERMMERIAEQVKNGPSEPGFAEAFDFTYVDPVDGSTSSRQGSCFHTPDGGRVVYRLSGTGTAGATLRVYIERYEAPAGDLGLDPQ